MLPNDEKLERTLLGYHIIEHAPIRFWELSAQQASNNSTYEWNMLSLSERGEAIAMRRLLAKHDLLQRYEQELGRRKDAAEAKRNKAKDGKSGGMFGRFFNRS